jgi:hypothetical protein
MTEDQRETIERAIEICNSVQMFATAKGLREILTIAQPVEQTRAKPVMWVILDRDGDLVAQSMTEIKGLDWQPLYAVPQPSPTAVVLDDERAAFEAWVTEKAGPLRCECNLHGEYKDPLMYDWWTAWEARSIAQPVEQTRALTDAVPCGWIRGVESYVPGEPTEWNVEFSWGDDEPEDGHKWEPVYRAALAKQAKGV